MAIDTLKHSNSEKQNPQPFRQDSSCQSQYKPIKSQGERDTLVFRGIVLTGGVGISILKQNYDTNKGGSGGRKPKEIKEVRYIQHLESEELAAGVGKCVFIDLGCQDLLHMMHEYSTIENKMPYRYASNQKAVETKTRESHKLRDSLNSDEVKAAELALFYKKTSTVYRFKLNKYLQERTKVAQVPSEYYSNEDAAENNREANCCHSES